MSTWVAVLIVLGVHVVTILGFFALGLFIGRRE